MRCLQPLKIRNPQEFETGDGFIQVACNKCINCLKNRVREWFLRLSVEANDYFWNSVSFVTLTYDDSSLRWADLGLFKFNTLCKQDLTKFFKRVRSRMTFKYYAIGEYGTHTLRPHYHFICFSSLPIDTVTDIIQDEWNLGFSLVTPVSPQRIGYVLHYHTRPKVPPLIDEKIKEFALDDELFQPSFSCSSQGLGLSLFTDELLNYLRSVGSGSVHYNGVRYKLPRYYLKKFDVPLKTSELDSSRKMLREIWSKDDFTEDDYVKLFIEVMKISKTKMNSYNLQTKQL